jgi:2-succinyl-6-hydroxy-2,4-cyclohexadiene-1-carboxylate synthase
MPELKTGGERPSIWYETKGDRSNDPIVLLHGFTGTHRSWGQVGERLAQTHFLILPDLPGHGGSGVSPSRAGMSLGATSDAVAEVMRQESGGRKAALLGYSLGARVALELACRHQELLSCLILEGASPGIEADDEREERRGKDDALADEIERRGVEWFVDYWQDTPLFATQKDLPRMVFDGVRRDRLSNSAHGLASSLRGAGTGAMAPLWDKIGGLRIPVLLVVGEKDRKYAEVGGAMRERIPGATVAEVDGAGHCVHVEKPQEFAALAGRFLVDSSATVRAAEPTP